MTFTLQTDHITTRPKTDIVRHKNGQLLREASVNQDGIWKNVYLPVNDPFAVDIGGIQHGWEEFAKVTGRTATVTAANQPQPARPSPNAKGILQVPIASAEFGMQHWVVSNLNDTEGFKALFELAMASDEAADGRIPVVEYLTGEDAYGVPTFKILGWTPRKPVFGIRLIPAPVKAG